MHGVTVFEFDSLIPGESHDDCKGVPPEVFRWLETRCLQTSEEGGTPWLKFGLRHGRRAIQLTGHVGVIRFPGGFQIEVLPKIGRTAPDGGVKARRLLIEMLRCLEGFRHIQLDRALVAAADMPLLEVFIGEFLAAVERVVKRGVRSDYVSRTDDLFALRGKLLVSEQIRRNLHRGDRFHAEFDEFSPNRPENRLLHAALRRMLSLSSVHEHQRLARELCFVFAEIPESTDIRGDVRGIRMDREMAYYSDALAWAKLILGEQSPLTGVGDAHAPSLLFPMESVFEAFVAKHLQMQMMGQFDLKLQPRSHSFVAHREQKWFCLKPDILLRQGDRNVGVLDTKWKLLDAGKSDGSEKYGLSQSDFYQVYAYGQYYLGGQGDVGLIYPRTEAFSAPLEVFTFPQSVGLRLWVLPFCLETRRVHFPEGCWITLQRENDQGCAS